MRTLLRSGWGRVLGVAASLLVWAAVAGAPPAASAAVPTQWIAKVTTESAGRAPTPGEWKFWMRYYTPRACSPSTLKTMGRAAYKSPAFLGRGYDNAEKLLALFRGVLNREPRKADVDFHLQALNHGSITWSGLVDRILESAEFRGLTWAICDPRSPGYGFRNGLAGDLKAWAGGTPSRTQRQLQAALDNARATCGTVALQRKEVVRIGGDQPGTDPDRVPLHVPPCVTLTTTGAPGAQHYAKMARLVPNGLICDRQPWLTCDHIELVRLGDRANLANVWVDGKRLDPANFKIGLVGIASGQSPTRVLDNRLSDPPADGTALRAAGWGTTRRACSGRIISRNLVTGYATQHAQTRLGTAQWADGLSIFCEQATVQDNHLVDISDSGIVLYGSWNSGGDWNSAAADLRTQRSTVSGNQIVSAGNSAHIALGADAAGECLANKDGPPVLCIEFSDDRGSSRSERSFVGTTVTRNTFWTGPRTHFDFGLMIGSASLWGDNGPSARGASFINNTTGGVASTRVHIGIAVSGMHATDLRANTASYRLIDANPDITEAKCPRGNVLYGHYIGSLAPGSQAAAGSSSLYHCFTPHPPAQGMERITVGPGGTLVGSASGRRFKPWGQDQTLGPGGVGHKVNVADLREMKEMGANVVRLHLQFRHFMSSCTTPNPTALEELGETLRRAEENGMYLDLTGLGSFAGDAADPACYRNATEDGRWAAQAVFWRAVAREAARSPAVLALDLMNEPRVPDKREYCWVTCGSGFGRYFVQLISQTPLGRSRATIARQWVTRMRDAIRAHDSKHLITLGCLPFRNCAGLDPATTAPLLNYLSVHINPDDGSTSDELDILAAYSATGDPVVVEETYPIRTADPAVMRSFLLGSRAHATGWLGHWGGKTLSQVMVDGDFRAAVWGLTFQRLTKTLSPCGACQP